METRPPIEELPPALLMEILSQLSWREQLGVRRVSHQWLEAVDACLAHRQELNICSDYLDTVLNTERLLKLLQNMPALKRFYVSDHYCDDSKKLEFSPTSVDQLCDSCPQLELVSLDCRLDEGAVETLLRRLPGLRSLHLDLKRSEIEGECLSLLPVELRSISLKGSVGQYATLNIHHLRRCRQLHQLDLSGNIVSGELAVVVASCPQLERLSVTNCRWLIGDWIPALKHCPQLCQLDLSRTMLHAEDLAAALAACPQLERLSVAHCISLTGTWLPELRHCPRLRDLDLSQVFSIMSEDLAVAVTACPQLERLLVTWCRDLTGDWLPELRHCPWLQELDISGLHSEELDLSTVLTACSRLERLRFIDMLDPLAAIPEISLPGVTHLDLSRTFTDDDTLLRLPDLMPNLRDLRLVSCKIISNSGLAGVLPRLTSLEVLHLIDTPSGGYGADAEKPNTAVSSLKGLPLRMLAYDYPGDMAVSDVLQHCPSLRVMLLELTLMNPGSARQIVAGLAKNPLPTDRSVILIAGTGAVEILASELPKNIRVLRNRPGHWERYVGW